MELSCYADVLLPLPLPGLFTYGVVSEQVHQVQPGIRVRVPFGKNKVYIAVIRKIHEQKPGAFEIRNILTIVDLEPVVTENQFRLWEWMSEYYMCTPGEVFRAALPSGLKITEKFRPKTFTSIRLTKAWSNKNKTGQLPGSFVRSPARDRLLTTYLALTENPHGYNPHGVNKQELLSKAETGNRVLSGLVSAGVFESYETVSSRLETGDLPAGSITELNLPQQKALEEIHTAFEKTDVVLLHGVTSSGKTEIYIRLIREAVEAGNQVLYLLPEIALTTQIIARLKAAFGAGIAVYHSKFSDAERVETWMRLLQSVPGTENKIRIVLGARSSVFLPFINAGLIIIDEEHENTYKQFDPAPRYHARDTAIMLARLHGARVLLGTATPSVETYYNCLTGKYGLVELQERYLDMALPEIKIVNTRDLKRRKQMHTHFSPALLDGIAEALNNKEQVILFQNRRGFSLLLECGNCGFIPRCRYCDVSLTYHKQGNRLNCHYCGYTMPVPKACPSCANTGMIAQGFGTEKIEEDIALLFPEARISRMDLDTTRTRKSFEQLISRFEQKESDILVGTQMVSKGLDFENVKLVGIMNADTMLNYPDFRAHERSFQLMAQVSGRAGRKKSRGTVIIQTADHTHPLIRMVVTNDFMAMFNSQLEERRKFQYPPFARLVEITLKHTNRDILDNAAAFLAGRLRKSIRDTILGPEYPLVSRVQNLYLKNLLVKIEKGRDLSRVKSRISDRIAELPGIPGFRSVRVNVDVDPY
jgi:primosomal protein N' (replication factor Y)